MSMKTIGILLNLKDKVSDGLINIAKNFTKTDKQAKLLANSMMKAGRDTALLYGAIKGSFTKIKNIVNENIQKVTLFADNIDKSSQKIGMSAKSYQQWGFIMSQSGGNVDNLSGAYKTLRNNIGALNKGSKEQTALFRQLGIRVKENNGQLRSQDAIFEDAIKSLQGISNETKRAILGQKLFGKGYQELAPILNSSSEDIEKLKRKYAELGLEMSENDIKGAVKLKDTMEQLAKAWEMIYMQIGIALVPAIQELNERLIDALPTIRSGLIPVLTGLGKLCGWVALNFKTLSFATTVLTGVFFGLRIGALLLNTTMLAFMVSNPFGWVLGAIALITTLIASVALLISHFKRLHRENKKIKVDSPQSDISNTETTQKPKRNALGTSFYSGGLTSVNENGGEIIDLPSGSRIYPADKSADMIKPSNNFNITLNIQGNVIGNQEYMEEMGNYLVGEIRKVIPA